MSPGDLQRAAGDLLADLSLSMSARAAAKHSCRRTDGDRPVLGLENVRRAVIASVTVRSATSINRLEIAQVLVGTPVLGELYGRAHQLVGILLELRLQPFQKREGVRRRAGEALPITSPFDRRRTWRPLPFITVWPRLHLAIARHYHLAALAHRDDGGRMHRSVRIVFAHESTFGPGEPGDAARDEPGCLRPM